MRHPLTHTVYPYIYRYIDIYSNISLMDEYIYSQSKHLNGQPRRTPKSKPNPIKYGGRKIVLVIKCVLECVCVDVPVCVYK